MHKHIIIHAHIFLHPISRHFIYNAYIVFVHTVKVIIIIYILQEYLRDYDYLRGYATAYISAHVKPKFPKMAQQNDTREHSNTTSIST